MRISAERLDCLEARSILLTDAQNQMLAAQKENESLKAEAARMQLVAGRYQYMHEHAQKALNMVDDLFEYGYLYMDKKCIQETVRAVLAKYTAAISKVQTKK